MIPLRLAFPVVCIAGSLESNHLVYVSVLLKILADSRTEERTINIVYEESSCSSSLTCPTSIILFLRTEKLTVDSSVRAFTWILHPCVIINILARLADVPRGDQQVHLFHWVLKTTKTP